MKCHATLFLAAMLFAGCASSGTYISLEQLDKVEVGMSFGEVHALLGSPTVDMPVGNRKRQWSYIYSEAYSAVLVSKVTSKTIVITFTDGKVDADPMLNNG
jgi:outer membrane protein assembly factor BamE (lipoprotein component of BamABCDE complex)